MALRQTSQIFLRSLPIAVLMMLCSFTYQPGDSERVEFTPPKPMYAPGDTVTIKIIGDVMMHQKQIDTAHEEFLLNNPDAAEKSPSLPGSYDFGSFLSELKPDFRNADLAIANMEFTLGGAPYRGYPSFSAPESYPKYVNDCGIEVFLTANNHILDKGYKGLDRTLGIYEEMEKEGRIAFTGCSRSAEDEAGRNPLFVRARGLKIAILNFTYGTNTASQPGYPHINKQAEKDVLKAALDKARQEEADLVLVIPHWGNEYQYRHSKVQEATAKWLAENGADIIVGAHTHCVQDIGKICTKDAEGRSRNVPVVYSMGNAVSNMDLHGCQLEIMVTVKFWRDSDGKTHLLDPSYEWLWCSTPGNYARSYCTIKLKDHLDDRSMWMNPKEWDKMMSVYRSTKKETGLE